MIAEFYQNEKLREAVKSYMFAVFNQEIIDRVYQRKSVEHAADAIELVDRAFNQMELDYAPKKEAKPTNEAR